MRSNGSISRQASCTGYQACGPPSQQAQASATSIVQASPPPQTGG